MTPSEKAIINTICYFDVFDYPLTLMEIWKWHLADYKLQTTDYPPGFELRSKAGGQTTAGWFK